MPFKKKKYTPKSNYLYVNEDGTQYLPDGVEAYAQIEEPPEGVDEFRFSIRILPASFSINSTNAASNAIVAARISSVDSNKIDKQELNASNHQNLVALAAAVEWDYVDENDQPIPPTPDSLSSLEPSWIYDAIKSRYDDINTVKNSRRG